MKIVMFTCSLIVFTLILVFIRLLPFFGGNIELFRSAMIQIGVLAVGIGFLLSFLFYKILIKPVVLLSKVMREVKLGNLDSKSQIVFGGDFGELNSLFNEVVKDWKNKKDILEEERRRFKDIAEVRGDWIWEVNSSGKYIYSNNLVEQILGYKSEEIIERHFLHDFLYQNPDDELDVKEKLLGFLKNKSVISNCLVTYLTKDSKEIFIEINAVPIIDDKGVLVGYRGVSHDITEKKIQDDKLKKAKDKMSFVSNAKTHFLANISHGIRTPMNVMLGFLDLFKTTPLTNDQKECLETVLLSGELLLVIVNQMMDLSKIEQGKLKLQSANFNLHDVIKESFNIVRPRLGNKPIDLTYSIEEEVVLGLDGDGLRLKQVLINLLDNAVKFTNKGSVCLNVSMDKDSSDGRKIVRFSIKDTGIGIPKDKQELIFYSAFTRVDGAEEEGYDYAGMGLAVSHAYIRLMDGEIFVKSEEGNGSEFMFTAKFQEGHRVIEGKVEPLHAEEVATNKLPCQDIRVLVVEDNPVNQKLVSALLSRLGCRLDIAENGKEGVEKIKDNEYDIVLMDVMMPEMDGWEATQIVRRDVSSDIPIVAVTAAAMKEDEEKSLAAGMNDYLAKPINLKQLEIKILRWVKGDNIQ